VDFCPLPPPARIGDKLYPAPVTSAPADLIERCREILAWQRTGVLRGDALRPYANARWPDEHDPLQIAEKETAREAFRILAMSELQLLRRDDVLKKVGISKSTLYKLISTDGFPASIPVGGSVAWVESEIDAWIVARVKKRGQAA